ncbi:MAG TPA: hypothetical protein VFL92_04030, partial [Sphingomonas sp.]|nr:hypothetical protein [Sphingomonas sp.]
RKDGSGAVIESSLGRTGKAIKRQGLLVCNWWFAVRLLLALRNCRGGEGIIHSARSAASPICGRVHTYKLCGSCTVSAGIAVAVGYFLADLDHSVVAASLLELQRPAAAARRCSLGDVQNRHVSVGNVPPQNVRG